jgi:alanine racemase
MKRPVWVEINLGALRNNVQEMRRITEPNAQLMAVVKANGYGHGIEQTAKTALDSGANWLGVALLQEAVLLREKGIKAPILILGYTPVEDADEVIHHDISQTIFTIEDARAFAAAAHRMGKKAKVHLKIDTGMGRLGFAPQKNTLDVLCSIVQLPDLNVEGIFTHFATADDADKSFAEEQFMRFQQLLKQLAAHHINIKWQHCANSAAVMDLPYTHLDLVRPGIALYGYYPSPHVRRDLVKLTPVMSLKARVAFLKEVSEGCSISYGRSYFVNKKTRIATIPLGYGDGYSRLLSNHGDVLIRGKRAPVVGRVCMDQLMVDVGHLPDVKQGDEVILLGRQGDEEITADELAGKLGTISYEVLCMISERVPRVYLFDTEKV